MKTTSPLPAASAIGRRTLLSLAAVAAVAAPFGAAQAQAFPNKPITLIVPWPAGGSTDRHLRALAEAASKHLGQNVIIDNKPGAGGTLGPATMAAQAKPDGYTISQYPMGMLRIPQELDVPLSDRVRGFPITGESAIDGADQLFFAACHFSKPLARRSHAGQCPQP